MALLAFAPLLLSACASSNDQFPSLARRPAERITGIAEAATPLPAPAPTLAPPNLALTARLAGLVEQARSAHGRFQTRVPRAEQAAGGGSMGSERWAVASVALAELESARSGTMVALADLDELFAAESVAGRDASAVNAARDQVIGWVGEEDRVLAELRRRM